MSWKLFSRDQVDRLTRTPQPPDDATTRECPVCREATIRHYYHDYRASGSPIPSGTSWFWCADCRKYASFTGASLQRDFFYDDPLEDEIESIVEPKLLERLNAEWENGVLPQTFTRKK